MIYKDINHWREGSPQKNLYILLRIKTENQMQHFYNLYEEGGSQKAEIESQSSIMTPLSIPPTPVTWKTLGFWIEWKCFSISIVTAKAYTMQCSLKVYNCWYKCLRDDRCKRGKSWWLLLSVVAVDRDALSIDDMEKRKRDKESRAR